MPHVIGDIPLHRLLDAEIGYMGDVFSSSYNHDEVDEDFKADHKFTLELLHPSKIDLDWSTL